MIIRLFVLLCAASLAFGYNPQPKVVTQGESEFQAAFVKAKTDEAKVAVAKEFLDKYPDNIPMGRTAQNILNRMSESPFDWKARMEAAPTTTNRYLYARASHDPKIMEEQAAWVMENEPENFWGYYMAATAEWDKDEPDMDKVTGYFEQALTKDPAQYNGYLWLGYAYEEAGKLNEALAVFDAAQIVDPEDESPKQAMLGLYAQLKNADKYFELATPMLPTEPITEKLASAEAAPDAKPIGFEGEVTVLEFFTYW